MKVTKVRPIMWEESAPKRIEMSLKEAKQLTKEISPFLEGMVVGENPLFEKLCKLAGTKLNLVS